jgi:hypothetical protein
MDILRLDQAGNVVGLISRDDGLALLPSGFVVARTSGVQGSKGSILFVELLPHELQDFGIRQKQWRRVQDLRAGDDPCAASIGGHSRPLNVVWKGWVVGRRGQEPSVSCLASANIGVEALKRCGIMPQLVQPLNRKDSTEQSPASHRSRCFTLKMPYRVEYASTGRAGCKGPEPCKGTKIGSSGFTAFEAMSKGRGSQGRGPFGYPGQDAQRSWLVRQN